MLYILFNILISFISAVAIVANTIIFLLVVHKQKLKSHSYIAVLAIIDFCTASIFITLHFLKSCYAALYVLGLLSRLSFVLLAIISWERYSAVRYPLHYRLSSHRFWQMMAWLLVPLVVFVALYTWGVSQRLGEAKWEETVGMCLLVSIKNGLETKIIETTSLLFPMPLVAVMIFCYTYIFKEYRRHIKHPVQKLIHREEATAKASLQSASNSCHDPTSPFIQRGFRVTRSRPASLYHDYPATACQVGSAITETSYSNKSRSLSPSNAKELRMSLHREFLKLHLSPQHLKEKINSPFWCPRPKSADEMVEDLEKKKQFRVAISLLTVIAFNIVTWLPYFVNYLSLTLDIINKVRPLEGAIMYCFLYSSVGFNTIIYSIRCRDIRDEFFSFIARIRTLCCTRQESIIRVLITPTDRANRQLQNTVKELDENGHSNSIL